MQIIMKLFVHLLRYLSLRFVLPHHWNRDNRNIIYNAHSIENLYLNNLAVVRLCTNSVPVTLDNLTATLATVFTGATALLSKNTVDSLMPQLNDLIAVSQTVSRLKQIISAVLDIYEKKHYLQGCTQTVWWTDHLGELCHINPCRNSVLISAGEIIINNTMVLK